MHLLRIGFYLIGLLSLIVWVFDVIYDYLFGKPIFVHTYFKKKNLSFEEKSILKRQVAFYKGLNEEYQKYFEHRLANFISNYEFVGRGGYVITAETKIIIGSVYVMMTFGMRKYLTNVFVRIVVYPEHFWSKSHDRNHKGEFNYRYRTVAFSWKDFIKGILIEGDNLNLGIHEFSHILSFHGRISKDYSAKVFYKKHKEIIKYIMTSEKAIEIKSKNFFRSYAYTNSLEFIAVMMEYFFESPKEFQKCFPELYLKVVKMINYKSFSN